MTSRDEYKESKIVTEPESNHPSQAPKLPTTVITTELATGKSPSSIRHRRRPRGPFSPHGAKINALGSSPLCLPELFSTHSQPGSSCLCDKDSGRLRRRLRWWRPCRSEPSRCSSYVKVASIDLQYSKLTLSQAQTPSPHTFVSPSSKPKTSPAPPHSPFRRQSSRIDAAL